MSVLQSHILAKNSCEEEHQCEGNGSGAKGWIQEEASGKTGGFLPPARTGGKI